MICIENPRTSGSIPLHVTLIQVACSKKGAPEFVRTNEASFPSVSKILRFFQLFYKALFQNTGGFKFQVQH